MTGNEPAGGTIDLSKEPVPARPGPAWIVVPARVIALIVVLPLRLVHDLLVVTGRGLRRGWNALTRALGRLGRFIGGLLRGVWLAFYRWLLAPIGRLMAAIGHGVGTLLDVLVVRPLRWLGVVVILGFLRWFGRGSGRLGRWLYRVLIAPAGRLLAVIGRGFALLFQGIGFLIGVLVVMPAVLLWRYVLRPPLLGLAWLGRGAFALLAALGSVLASGLSAFAAGLVWSWRLLGRCLGWLGRVLFVLPARALWRYVLAPVVAGVAGTWRLASRLLRWLWRTLVVVPVRVVVVAPARWMGTSVLRPIGHGIRGVWRVSVREPLAAARRAMRQASQDVRRTLRRSFGGR
ncbi:hypothetical protein [Actinomadura latina]|uniref:Uncharacterized protein n=1 Tax=Actinomadura latina TaxID=163603 RepID=A0A846YZP0_9ACTN|nr:hypothetical protein [Actinomadura latina]NKZ03583.1 hypothetical protein [Actinomadura latina]